MSALVFDQVWKWRCRLPERYGSECRIVRTLRPYTVEVAFPDGFSTITSSYAVGRRRARG